MPKDGTVERRRRPSARRRAYRTGYRRDDGVWVYPTPAYVGPEKLHRDPFFAMVGDGSTKKKRAAGNE